MNLKKAALLAVLCTAAIPAIGNAKPSQDNRAQYTAQQHGFKRFFVHLITFGQVDR